MKQEKTTNWNFRIAEILSRKIRQEEVSVLSSQIDREIDTRSTGFLLNEGEILAAKFLVRQYPAVGRLNCHHVWGIFLEIFPENTNKIRYPQRLRG